MGLLFCAFLIYNKGVFKLEITERLGVLTERSFTMKQLYLKPYMTIFCITEDVLTESVEKQIRYNEGDGDGDSVPFAG